MPLEVRLWSIDGAPRSIPAVGMDAEKRLEDLLFADLSLADPELLLIGRQVPTSSGGRVDLLAMNSNGDLVVLELKRDKTPRDVVAQTLDYAHWVRSLRSEDVAQIFASHGPQQGGPGPAPSLDAVFCKRFQVRAMPDELNREHHLVIVASELDPETERIVEYLAEEGGIQINALFFRVFRDGERQILARAWLRDPASPDAGDGPASERGQWNGEYYVSFGQGDHRDWAEAEKFGFVSAGGGSWYTRTLNLLEPGSRIWVNVPGAGYVGVGTVEGRPQPLPEFKVQGAAGQKVPLVSVAPRMARALETTKDHEQMEHVVPVRWIKTVPLAKAVKEKGFFGNQNSAAQPRAARWEHTVRRLRAVWGLAE